MAIAKNNYSTLVLSILATSCYHAALSLSCSDESLSLKHEKWMGEHGRSYANEEEKQKRFNIFKYNVQHMERFNRERSNHTYKLGINKFADLTNEEFLAKFAGSNLKPYFKISSSSSSSSSHMQSSSKYDNNVKDLPPSVDWRDHNAVTPVQNQGQCGCCWAFSAVAAIEGIVSIRSGKLIPLSEQHLVDCNYGREGCSGGRMDHAFDFVTKNGGLASDIDYPYTATQRPCTNNNPASAFPSRITGFGLVENNNEAALLAAVANQPVAVSIDPKLLQFYHSGVLRGECGTSVTHAVAAIGYGTSEDGVKYWLFKNSWGADWGDRGFFKLERDIDAKEGMCGIATYPSYPTA